MEQNPYESPKEVEQGQKKGRGLLAIIFATIALIPAGCICGGLTCYSAGIFGDIVAGDTLISGPAGNDPVFVGTAGWFLGIPLGLLAMGFTWYVFGREIWKRRQRRP